MSRSRTLLGVDLGTSALKATLVDTDGAVVAEAEAAYDVVSGADGKAETDPDQWLAALRSATRRLGQIHPAAPDATGWSGQMHGLVVADEAGKPRRPAILWPDQRSGSVLERWRELPAPVRARLSNPIVAGMTGPILTWLAGQQPGLLFGQVRSPKDWLRQRLTGDDATERSDASATLLWDVSADDWCTEALALAEIESSVLPEVVGSAEVVGEADWATNGGVVRVPSVAGGSDAACVLTSLLALNGASDALVVNMGTGIQVLRPAADGSARVDPVTHLYADCDGGWYEMLGLRNGGSAVAWGRDVLGLDHPDLVAAAAAAPAGSAGATFVPFLTGERGGVAGADSRAAWCGLDHAVGRGELARSVLESQAFLVRRGVERMAASSTGPVTLTGGGSRDAWFRQLVADVLGRPVRYVALRSASAVGAAVLAARGVGITLPVHADVVEHEPVDSAALEAAYARWRSAVE